MDNTPLIDLGSDYYILKFSHPHNMNTVLCKGPWFLYGHYLSIQKWVPNFIPEKVVLIESAVWIRLSHLPTEYYDSMLLQRIGNSISTLLKIDVCTSSTLRGRYARLCVQVPFDHPL